jgi:hypothetical protein
MRIKAAILAVKRVTQSRRGARIRAQVAASFRKVRNGIDDKAVYAITKDWYRSSGGAWTLCLS